MRRPVAIPATLLGAVLLAALIGGGGAARSPSMAILATTPSAPPLVDHPDAIQLVPMPGGIIDPQPVPWEQVTV